MSTNTLPTCPTGCGGTKPQLDFDYCNPTLGYGQIDYIFLGSYTANCFTDWESLNEWLARLSNTSAANDAIRWLHVVGDSPVPTRDENEISLGRKVLSPGSFVANVEVDDVSALNYEFMRASQCNTSWKVWYATADYLFGGVCGIDGLLSLGYAIEKGKRSLHKMVGTVKWEAKFSPERVANPLSGTILT